MSFINNQSQLSNVQNRSEFIEKFKQEHTPSSTRNIVTSNPNARWNYLHDLNRLKQAKLAEKREQQRIREQEKSFSECTFTPKLNKSVNYTANSARYLPNNQNSSFNGVNIHTEASIDLINRQEAWNQRKNTKLESMRQNISNKEIEQCYFTPSINRDTALNKSHIKSNAVSLLEDPESYQMYIKRLEKKREEDDNKRKRENSTPGSGKIWKKKNKKYNLSYDYTKHQITDKCIPKSKSTNKLKGQTKSSKQLKEMDKDKFFDYLYQNKSTNNMRRVTTSNKSTISNVLYEQQIEYGKAIEILHNELFNFPLLDDEE